MLTRKGDDGVCHCLSGPTLALQSLSSFERRGATEAMTREGGMPPAKASSPFPTKPTIPDERVQRIVRLIHSGASFDIGDLVPTAPVQAAG